MTLHTRRLLASDNEDVRNGLLDGCPAVYSSSSFDTGSGYATPQLMFNDGIWHRVHCACVAITTDRSTR